MQYNYLLSYSIENYSKGNYFKTNPKEFYGGISRQNQLVASGIKKISRYNLKDRVPVYKIILIGPSSTGKTSLIERFSTDNFKHKHKVTLIDMSRARIQIHGQFASLEIWDTAGQEKHGNLIRTSFNKCLCAVAVFDITNPESIQ